MFRHQFSYYYFIFVLAVLLLGVLLIPVVVSGDTQTPRYAPGNYLSEDQISVYADKVVLDVHDALLAKFEDTDSMVPFFDAHAHALQYVPTSAYDIQLGDVISFIRVGDTVPVIHRVVYIGQDKQGIYYVVQGDNNAVSDPGKVRFNQVQSIVFAILY